MGSAVLYKLNSGKNLVIGSTEKLKHAVANGMNESLL